uniref:Uncharacterized protein n=1 Tax=Chrysotila carterae TaxID=13221 RepID=A0A7S4C075_CHRCT|mmetsp:Transcript_57747/g.125372  ORF Transcript_57747/g.125372 Transcript_57747/m.125372 type:complete len:284 (+) Transcript_57747:214-1065(+)|eukprot:5615248-Pleurochrysis_carterae.AAC.2
MTDAKKVLQSEVVAVKTRWADQVKISKAGPESPTAPLPIGVQRCVPQPEAASAFDQNELNIKLWVDSLDPKEQKMRVEVLSELPAPLREAIAEQTLGRWQKLVAKAEGSWRLETIFTWVEDNFSELLLLLPEHIEQYHGVDTNGMTIRRYTIVELQAPAAAESDSSSQNSDGEESDGDGGSSDGADGTGSELTAEQERLLRIKLAAEREADRVWREARRKEAEELGEAARQQTGLSKKEQQARIKEKQAKAQGVRLRKAGAKANKFDAEAAGKKPNKKNGLLH